MTCSDIFGGIKDTEFAVWFLKKLFQFYKRI